MALTISGASLNPITPKPNPLLKTVNLIPSQNNPTQISPQILTPSQKANISLGNKATTPYQNIQSPKTTLPPNQISNKPAPVNPTAYTYSGGVNALGQTLPGYGTGTQNSNNQGTANTGTGAGNGQTSQPGTNGVPFSPTDNGLYGQLIAALANKSNQTGTDYLAQQKLANQYNQALQQSRINEAQGLAANAQNPIPLEFQQGRAQVLQSQYAQEQAALGAGFQGASNLLGAANTQQQLQQQGLGTAAGLAAPQQVGYNVQYVNPLTGQGIGGGQIGGSLQSAVQNVVQKLTSGQMTYNDAVNALSGYGQGGVNALQQALPSGFNIAQSNTLAGQQGSIGPAYSFAKSALLNLQNIVRQLGIGQGTNIPILNAIGNLFSTQTGIGADKTRQYIGAVQEARNAYAQLLAASRGGTPTEYGAQANAAIPDNATPNDIQAAINNLESLGQSKLNIYGNPGQSTTTQNGPTSSNIWSW